MLENALGIIGGMGPKAGVDFCDKIISQTRADRDQHHLPFVLYSLPEYITDRTEYLTEQNHINPADALGELILKMDQTGIRLACMVCNTAHAEPIFGLVENKIAEAKLKIKLLHIVNETGHFIKIHYPDLTRVGILSTSGTYYHKVYARLDSFSLKSLYLDKNDQTEVHNAIYHKEYGIKANSENVPSATKELLCQKLDLLIHRGAEIILLGCTELPLLFTGKKYKDTPLIDPALILARAMIREHSPNKLKPY